MNRLGLTRGILCVSLLAAVTPALVGLIANGYWLQAPLPESAPGYRPEGLFDQIPQVLIVCFLAELILLLTFSHWVKRHGGRGLLAYSLVNLLPVLWYSSILVKHASPWSVGGWELLAVWLGVLAAPLLSLVLAGFEIQRARGSRKTDS